MANEAHPPGMRGFSPRALLHWDEASGTGLAKDGCCGYRRVARCAKCRLIGHGDEMRLEASEYRCARC